MEYRKRKDFEVSEISLGCMSLNDRRSAEKIIHKSLDMGINLFDTADLYQFGENEKWVGSALKENRRDILLATKAGNDWHGKEEGWEWNADPSYIRSCLEESLRRLQTDYIDFFMMHGGTMDDPIDDLITEFEKFKKEGKIRAYGISSIRPAVIKTWRESSSMDAIMMQYSPLDRRPEEECLPLVEEAGYMMMVRGAFARGMLLDKEAKEYLGYNKKQVDEMKKAIKAIGDPLEVCLQFALNSEAVGSITTGASSIEQIEEILTAYERIKKEDLNLEALNTILPKISY